MSKQRPFDRGRLAVLQDAVHYALRADPKTQGDSTFDGASVKSYTRRPQGNRSWLALARASLRSYGISAARLRGLSAAQMVALAKSEAKKKGWDAYSDSRLCGKCGNPTYGNGNMPCPHH